MKAYVIGSVGSGKSTFARQLAAVTGISCTHLDEVVYEEDPTDSWGNRKRPIEERDAQFYSVLGQESYIMEDAGRSCFLEGMQQADVVILLEPPLLVRKKRIVLRWMKQRLGVEACIYRPTWAMLKAMFKWGKNYESGEDGTKSRIQPFSNKTIVLRCNREIRSYLATFGKENRGS